jgi:hypothetical protein
MSDMLKTRVEAADFAPEDTTCTICGKELLGKPLVALISNYTTTVYCNSCWNGKESG